MVKARTQFVIGLLGDHPDALATVVQWHWDEWGADYPDSSLAEWTAQLSAKTRTDGLPCTWIALVDGAPVGSVTVELDGVEPRPELKPDLAGLFVLPEHRGRGIGSALVTASEEGACAYGVRDLYLYTERAQRLYERLGWRTLEHTHFLGQPAAIMCKRIGHGRQGTSAQAFGSW